MLWNEMVVHKLPQFLLITTPNADTPTIREESSTITIRHQIEADPRQQLHIYNDGSCSLPTYAVRRPYFTGKQHAENRFGPAFAHIRGRKPRRQPADTVHRLFWAPIVRFGIVI